MTNTTTKNGVNSAFHLIFLILIDRYECPAGCLDAAGKIVGTVYYEMVSTQVDQVKKIM